MPEYAHAHEGTCLGFHMHDMACMLKSEDNFLESIFFFSVMDPEIKLRLLELGTSAFSH